MKSVGACRLAATVCPTFNRTRDHDAVDGRGDDGLLQIHLGLRDSCLRLRDLRRRGLYLRLKRPLRDLGSFEIGSCDQLARLELASPSEFDLGIAQLHLQPLDVGFGAEEVRLRPLDVCLDERRIEPGEHLPLPDDRVEVRVE